MYNNLNYRMDITMKLYFAPLEGITTYTFRNTHYEMFGGCDEYFAPFITPCENEKLSIKNMRDILPENNSIKPVVQALASSETAFVDFTKKIAGYGYAEVNLNLGCPSGTVVKKGRGAGALRDTYRLNEFLNYIFENSKAKISIKTRTGFYSHDEFCELMNIYNKYPVSELIVHPRVREEYYNLTPNMQSFDLAYAMFNGPLCYNGNIYSIMDYQKIAAHYPNVSAVMIGRGAIKNPAIFREIKGGKKLTTAELVAFSNELEKRYFKLLNSDMYTLHKLKEIWIYVMQNFPEEKKILKAVKKSNKLIELNSAINCLPEIKYDN